MQSDTCEHDPGVVLKVFYLIPCLDDRCHQLSCDSLLFVTPGFLCFMTSGRVQTVREFLSLWFVLVSLPPFLSVPSDRTTWWISLPNPSGLVFLPLPRRARSWQMMEHIIARVAVCVQWSLRVGERYESQNIWIILCMCVLLIRVLCEFAWWHLHPNKLLRVSNCFQKNTDK